MKEERFNSILKERIDSILGTLAHKAKEYASDDRLYNFKRAAEIQHTTTAKALWGMASKHLVSVIDLVEGRINATPEMVNEKIGDMINYLILLEAVLKEDNICE